MTTHDLKLWPQFWDDLASGVRAFDIRFNDRGYTVGDFVVLHEWDPATSTYTGREETRQITYVLRALECPARAITEGYVAIGYKQ